MVDVVIPENQPISYYKGIINLPLHKFIDCDVDGNLSALIISGLPTSDELSMAWIDIQQEYSQAIGNIEQKIHTKLFQEVAELSFNWRQSQICIDILRMTMNMNQRSEVFESNLSTLVKRKLPFNWDDPEAYEETLQLANTLSKAFKRDFLIKNAALRMEQNEEKKLVMKKSTRENYYSILNVIGDSVHVVLDDKMVTFSFCDRLKRYNEKQQAIRKSNVKK